MAPQPLSMQEQVLPGLKENTDVEAKRKFAPTYRILYKESIRIQQDDDDKINQLPEIITETVKQGACS